MVKLYKEVISSIASLAAQEVEGVRGLRTGIMNSLSEIFGAKGGMRGVKVELGDANTKITLFIIAEYGVNIPEVASSVQDNVRGAIERMAGLANVEVNVEVVGIAPKEVK